MLTKIDPRLADPTLQYLAARRVQHRKLQAMLEGGEGRSRTALFRPLPPEPQAWLRRTFPTYFQDGAGNPIPFAGHQQEMWAWIWSLRPGQGSAPFIGIWARGGGKSTTTELGTATIGYFGLRRYGLYICNTQKQADDHVASIATALEGLDVPRALNRYGFSRGWNINRLRTADGFTVDAVGMDVAIRGIRIDEDRPDLIILDDLDDESDSALTIEKKVLTLTRKILPASAAARAVVGVQNIPNVNGIFARLADGRAEFLLDRTVSGPYPALADLPATDWWTREEDPDGRPRIRITAGTPTWIGQGIPECESLIALIGITGFLVECQHLTALLEGKLFQRQWFSIVQDWPRVARRVRFWDFASTEENAGTRDDPDWTVGLLLGEWHGQFWVMDMQRVRLTPKGVEDLVRQTAVMDGREVAIYLEQEGGSSGKTVVDDYRRRVLQGFTVSAERPTGPKAERARPVSSAAEAGNVFLVEALWNEAFLEEVPRFGLPGVHDDIVDALSGAHSALTTVKRAGTWGSR